jgi:8-oxo-dGTP pyrophosphatase MutT (NUDIX family)
MQTRSEFYRSLPKKRMASAVLLFNEQHEILVVQPTYKEDWELPGGAIELGESPKAALVREAREELNLDLNPEELDFLLLDYMAGNGDITEALMFVFSGGYVSEEQINRIQLPADELKSYTFAEPKNAARLLGAIVGDRLLRALKAKESAGISYFEGRY